MYGYTKAYYKEFGTLEISNRYKTKGAVIVSNRILLASPHMSEEGYELQYIQDAFQKNWIAPLGENVNEFENAVQGLLTTGHMVALAAGTAALHLALILAGVTPGDEQVQ